MGTWLDPQDLALLAPGADVERLGVLIEDIEAQAIMHAPCIVNLMDGAQIAAIKSILRQAALRWHVAGDGEVTTQSETVGPASYSVTTSPARKGAGRLYDNEVQDLRNLCGGGRRRRAFSLRPR